MQINWWAITTVGFWISCAITSAFIKEDCMGYAVIASLLLGVLYCIVRGL